MNTAGTKAYFEISDASGTKATVTGTIPTNQWVFVAGTLDNATGTMDFYVNNTLAQSITTAIRPLATPTLVKPPAWSAAWKLATLRPGERRLQWVIDELRISDVCMTTNQMLVPEQASVRLCMCCNPAGVAACCRRRKSMTK